MQRSRSGIPQTAIWAAIALFLFCSAAICAKSLSSSQNQALAVPTAQTKVIELNDPARGKQLPIRVTWYDLSERCPIIVFSHGAAGSREGYDYLVNYWAHHGYICIQPTHADSVARMRELGMKGDILSVERAIPTDGKGWVNRARDISFVIDSLPSITQQIPQLAGKLDATSIGVAGHSYGAFTSMIVSGARLPSNGGANLPVVQDKRIRATIAISPQGVRSNPKFFGFDNAQSWNAFTGPVMFVTGDRDSTGWSSVKDRKVAFDSCPPGNKYFVLVKGATHMTFAGPKDSVNLRQKIARAILEKSLNKEGGAYGNEKDQLAFVETATTEFWDAYLKNDDTARQFLQGKGGLANRSPDIATFQKR